MATDVPFRQSDRIIDHVVPLVQVESHDSGLKVTAFLGTGFICGENLGMTAHHVLNEETPPSVGIVINHQQKWHYCSISGVETHPVEDVCLFTLEQLDEDVSWQSFLRPSSAPQYASLNYSLWGYPADVLYEVVHGGFASPRPDLVYSEGHVRRRMSDISLEHLRGRNFYELSQRGGSGFSGGPVISNRSLGPSSVWQVVGIYIGERVSGEGISVGYATRLDSIAAWRPALLNGSSIFGDEDSSVVTGS